MCLLISLLLASSWILSSCAATQPQVISQGVPEGYVIVKKDVLANMMQSCERCKSELLDCLGKLPRN